MITSNVKRHLHISLHVRGKERTMSTSIEIDGIDSHWLRAAAQRISLKCVQAGKLRIESTTLSMKISLGYPYILNVGTMS